MTVTGTPAPRRLRLFSGWRTRLTGTSTPATTARGSAAPEEVSQVGHIYPSTNTEPGETTTALGRHHTAEHVLVTPRETGEKTQVIRVNPGTVERKHGGLCSGGLCFEDDFTDECTCWCHQGRPSRAGLAAVIALDPATEVSLSAELEQADPPIYLETLAAVERLRALPATTDEPEEGETA